VARAKPCATFLHLALMYKCAYNMAMKYEWDAQKAGTNLRKHGINFADATTVFGDDFAITIPDDHADEERYVTVGMDALGRVLVVVFTWRGANIRMISARKAEKFEIEQYQG
jgi:hypothetical protein